VGPLSTTPPQGPWDFPPPSGPPPGSWPGPGGSLPSYPGGPTQPGNWTNPTTGTLAGWWLRAGATIIDLLVLGVVGAILQAAAGKVPGEIVGVVIDAAYVIILVGSRGQTLGNMAVGTQVVAADGSGQVGYGRAALRWLIDTLLEVTVIGGILDILWPLWDSQNQTIHDKAAGTVVIRVR
jgi:uncharacterized RDD family membrane protein YckC